MSQEKQLKQGRYACFIKSPEMEAAEASFNHWKTVVSEVFINALLACDKNTILELADAAEFFKDKLGIAGKDFAPADPERLKLLKIKNQPRLFQRTFTIRQIAEQIYDKNSLKDHAVDGFSALRRKCKELEIPIRASRKIKGK